MLKRYVELKAARQTIILAPGKNPYEAWRLLFAKFVPRNDATAGAVVMKVCDWQFWKCKSLADVPFTISAWEKMQDDYFQEFQLAPINDLTEEEKEWLIVDMGEDIQVRRVIMADLPLALSMKVLRKVAERDEVYQKLKTALKAGKKPKDRDIVPYMVVWGELGVIEELVCRGERIVIP